MACHRGRQVALCMLWWRDRDTGRSLATLSRTALQKVLGDMNIFQRLGSAAPEQKVFELFPQPQLQDQTSEMAAVQMMCARIGILFRLLRERRRNVLF